MDGVLYQSPVQGFGYGRQGEMIFDTSTAYNQLPQPEFPDRSVEEEYSDDSERGDDRYDVIYGALDMQRVYGKQVVVWTHRYAETVALFTPVEGDTFVDVVKFARSMLQFNTAVDKMMLLLPGHKRPLDMDGLFHIKPGTAVLITPLYDYVITLEVKQLGHKVDMVLSIDLTVLELKGRLQTERGYPAEQTDLLYRDQPLENSRYLFEYGLAHSSTVFVLLTMRHSTLVHVETFWGKRYHLHVDACTTGLEIIDSVLRRTVSQNVTDVVRLYELFLPKHTLVLYLGTRIIDWDTCLGLYGLEDGSVLRLTTIGLAHNMSLQRVPVKLLDSGREHRVQVSKFDRWSAVVLKLHGMTGYPVNLMRLFRGSAAVDFSDSVGVITPQAKPVKLDTTAVMADDDVMYGITLKFKVMKGVNELLKVAPSRSIKSVKDTLERVGVANASITDLIYNGHRLPNTKRVVDVIDDYKTPIEVSMRQYPVFIHGDNNIIYRMLAHSKESLAAFLMRVAIKVGLSLRERLLLSCGMVLHDSEDTPVMETRITPRSSIFIVPRYKHRTFLILHGDWLTKLKIPFGAGQQQIKDILWKERDVPEGGLASIGNFLQWYFAPQIRDGKYNDQALPPMKERMLVYEQKVNGNVMKLKTEPTAVRQGRRAGRQTNNGVGVRRGQDDGEDVEGEAMGVGHRQRSYLDTTLEELERCALRHRRREKRRRQTMHTGRRGGLPHLPRHMSAAELVGRPDRRYQHASHMRRKAYTTDPELYGNRLPGLPLQNLNGGRGHRSARRKSQAEVVNEVNDNGDNDWVFSLTHEVVENPRRQRTGKKY